MRPPDCGKRLAKGFASNRVHDQSHAFPIRPVDRRFNEIFPGVIDRSFSAQCLREPSLFGTGNGGGDRRIQIPRQLNRDVSDAPLRPRE
jgi:hypothetical protein